MENGKRKKLKHQLKYQILLVFRNSLIKTQKTKVIYTN